MDGRMDIEANGLIRLWSEGQFPEDVAPSDAIEACTKKMGNRLSGIYRTAIDPNLLNEYGRVAGDWILNQIPGLAFGYGVSKVGNALKQVYRDRANGKKPPTPEEFKKTLSLSGKSATRTSARGDLTVKDSKGNIK